jgi:hypothetical protein
MKKYVYPKRYVTADALSEYIVHLLCEKTRTPSHADMECTVIKLYKKYHTVKATARQLCVCHQYVRAIVTSHGLPVRSQGGPNNKLGKGGLPKRYETLDGVTLCRAAWAKQVGISPQLLDLRMSKLGWSLRKSLETPVKEYH